MLLMHGILDSPYESLQKWKAGELTRYDFTDLIHKIHKDNQEIDSFFT